MRKTISKEKKELILCNIFSILTLKSNPVHMKPFVDTLVCQKTQANQKGAKFFNWSKTPQPPFREIISYLAVKGRGGKFCKN